MRQTVLVYALALILTANSLAFAAASPAEQGTGINEEWIVICSSSGNYLLNRITGERRPTRDTPQHDCSLVMCHANCRRLLMDDSDATASV